MTKAQTSASFSAPAGSSNGVVVVRSRSGLALQKPKKFRRAISSAQHEAMVCMTCAGLAWNELAVAD